MGNQAESRAEHVSPQWLQMEKQRWRELERDLRTPELMREFRQVQVQARGLFYRLDLALRTPSPDAHESVVQPIVERLVELWQQALSIHARSTEGRVTRALKAESLEQAEAGFEERLDTASDNSETRESGAIVERMKQIAKKLCLRPEDVRQGDENIRQSYYVVHQSGNLIPHIRIIDKDLAFLRELAGSTPAKNINPALRSEAQRLIRGLEELRRSGPKDIRRQYDWYQAQFGKYNTNWGPLRGVLVVFGGIVTMLGLGHTLVDKNHRLSPMTLLWAFITVAAANPSMFDPASKKAMEKLAFFNSTDLKTLVKRGFKGKDGAEAFQELQAAYEDPAKRTLLQNILRSRGDISNADIASLCDSPNSPLIRLLSGWSPAAKRKALTVFGRKRFSKPQVALTSEFLAGAP